MKEKILNVLLALFVIVAVGSIASIGWNYCKEQREENKFQKLREMTETVNTEVQEESETSIPESKEVTEDILSNLHIVIPEKQLDFATLQQENSDIYAWLYIPDTGIDYPILQHPSDDSFYLNHNLNLTEGRPACIYTEKVNKKDFSDPNTVIYGHNMKNGTMFAELHGYEDQSFFDAHPYFFIYTSEKTYVYQVFAAYRTEPVHLLNTYDFQNPQFFQEYLQSIWNNQDETVRKCASVRDEVHHIVTLSTCDEPTNNLRFLVQGILLNE